MSELEGLPVTAGQAQVLALTNYGHFTSMLVEDARVRGLALHLERLVRDARRLFDAELDPAQVRSLVRQALGGGGGRKVVRVTVFDPDLGLAVPSEPAHPRILVTTRPAAEGVRSPLRVRTSSYCRDLPAVKHAGLFGPVWERRRAQQAGFDDVLFVDEHDCVSEGATWNVGFVDDDQVVFPDAEVLSGVTLALLRQVHVDVRTARVHRSDLERMQAAFATNAAIGVCPIRTVDGLRFQPDHPVVRQLQDRYAAIPGEPV